MTMYITNCFRISKHILSTACRNMYSNTTLVHMSLHAITHRMSYENTCLSQQRIVSTYQNTDCVQYAATSIRTKHLCMLSHTLCIECTCRTTCSCILRQISAAISACLCTPVFLCHCLLPLAEGLGHHGFQLYDRGTKDAAV